MVHSRRVTVARARPRASSSRAKAFDVGAADGEQVQGAGAAPAGELAQVQCVRLACQAAESGQEPGEGEPLGIGEGGKAGPVPVPAVKRKPNVSCLVRSRYATNKRALEPGKPGEKCSRSPNPASVEAQIRVWGSRRGSAVMFGRANAATTRRMASHRLCR